MPTCGPSGAQASAEPTALCPIHRGTFKQEVRRTMEGIFRTLGSKIAASYQGASTRLQAASLIYLGLILLVLSLIANIAAQWIVRRVARKHGVTRGGHA